MSREYGRGSIVSFVVVGVLLVALVLGGLYVTKNGLGEWLDQVGGESNDTAEVATNSDNDNSGDDTGDTNDQPADEDEAPAPADEPTVAPEEEEPAVDETPAPSEDEADEADRSDEVAVNGDNDDQDPMPTTGVELPQTGLGDSLIAMLPVVVLAGAAVAYRRSNML